MEGDTGTALLIGVALLAMGFAAGTAVALRQARRIMKVLHADKMHCISAVLDASARLIEPHMPPAEFLGKVKYMMHTDYDVHLEARERPNRGTKS